MARYPSTSLALRHLRAVTVGNGRWYSIHLYGLCLDEVRGEVLTRPAFGGLSTETRRAHNGDIKIMPLRHIFEVQEPRPKDVGMMPVINDGGASADRFIRALHEATLNSRIARKRHPLTGEVCTKEQFDHYYPDATSED
jgi:hypothetical protein